MICLSFYYFATHEFLLLADGCNKGTRVRKRLTVLSRRVTSQKKLKLEILEIKKNFDLKFASPFPSLGR